MNQAIATGPATSEACTGLVSSRYFSDIEGVGLPNEKFTTLAEQIPSRYYCVGRSTNALTSEYYNFNRGFDKYVSASESTVDSISKKVRDRVDLETQFGQYLKKIKSVLDQIGRRDRYSPHHAPASEIVDFFIDEFRTNSSPVFAFGHFMDVHHPYEPPENLPEHVDQQTAQQLTAELDGLSLEELQQRAVELNTEDVFTLVYDCYKASCQYFDEQLARLLDTVSEDTLTVIVGDHGELFNEHGLFGHPQEMWDELVHVPCIIHHPDIDPLDISSQQSMVDFAPTVLSLLGNSAPAEMRGSAIDLSDPSPNETAFGLAHSPEVSAMARSGSYKWVRHNISPLSGLSGRKHGEMLFKTGGEESISGGQNLYRKESEIASQLRRRFTSEISSDSEASGVGYDDEELQDHLESLGYA
jgi:arylsulfatase A-like enzyme